MIGREKRCESCGSTFECRGLWFCWCRSVQLDDRTRAELRQRFTDCLCPQCLERYSHAAEDSSGCGEKPAPAANTR
jgi:hypothetical protein